MVDLLKKAISNHVPEMNPDVINGLAVDSVNNGFNYIVGLLEGTNKSLPAGIRFEGARILPPKEQFKIATKPWLNKRWFNIAPSSLYLIEITFSMNGKHLLDKYIYLPIAGPAGECFLSGTKYFFTPVLTDLVISPTHDGVFIRLLRDRLNFYRLHHTIRVNGTIEAGGVIWGGIYKSNSSKNKDSKTCKTTIFHYLVAKLGFEQTFQKFLNFIPVFTDQWDREKYPLTEYVVCENPNIKHPHNNIKAIIPLNKWTVETQNFIYSFYYLVSKFPAEITLESIYSTNFWGVLLGGIIWPNDFSPAKLYANLSQHFNSIDDYLDSEIQFKLKQLGYNNLENIYDLFGLILCKFNEWVAGYSSDGNNMYRKALEVYQYAFYDIAYGIYSSHFQLNTKHNKKPLTPAEAIRILTKQIKPGRVYQLKSNICVQTVQDPGDHKYLKITSTLPLQHNVSGKETDRSASILLKNILGITFSVADVGCVHGITKSSIDARKRINPFIGINMQTGNPILKDEYVPLRDEVDNMLFLPAELEIENEFNEFDTMEDIENEDDID